MLDSLNINWDFLWDRNSKKLDQQFTDWLYSNWSEQKYEDYKILDMVPGVHQYMDYLLDKRADSEYLSRYGMDFTDIHDPRKLSQTSSANSLYGFGYRMISKNIDSLYE